MQPRVFISYSWDNPEHRKWVRELAERLVKNGVIARLDQWHIAPGESLTHFMEEEVSQADYVIVVCTPAFAAKSNARRGGAGYEQQIVSGHLLSGSLRRKFIPILRVGSLTIGVDCAIPTHFSGIYAIDFRDDTKIIEQFDELLRALFKSPRFLPPELGPIPSFDETSLGALPGVFYFDAHLKPRADTESLAITFDEALQNWTDGIDPPCDVGVEGYEQNKAELKQLEQTGMQSLDVRKRRLALKNLIQPKGYKFDIKDQMADIIYLIVRFAVTFGISDGHKLVECLSKTLYRRTQGTPDKWSHVRFDVFIPDKCSAAFYLTSEESDELAKRKGVPLGALTVTWGLDFWDFSEAVLIERMIPAMVCKYVDIKHTNAPGKLPPGDEYFHTQVWRIGLG